MEKKVQRNNLNFYSNSVGILIILVLWLCHSFSFSFEKRSRWKGLNQIISSSTIGEGNLYLTMHGRTFLWDNNAAGKVPTMLPHMDVGYGILDYLHIIGGLQVRTTKPSLAYMKLKLTTPNTKNIRFLGIAQTLEVYKNMLNEFKSNGFRFKNEGFTPDHFLFGSSNVLSFYRTVTAIDFELIKISSSLPIKFYINVGYESSIDSWMKQNADEAKKNFSPPGGSSNSLDGTSNFSKVPISLGAEIKTLSTDFFVELESEGFYENFEKLILSSGSLKDRMWVRYHIVVSGRIPLLKVVDIHLLESPIYLNLGANLKYGNGSSFQVGFSWMFSQEVGPSIGPCDNNPDCSDGATDGYSPFYPQWRLFGRFSYPISFKQTSSELYRTYLLRKNKKIRKVLDIDKRLKNIQGEDE